MYKSKLADPNKKPHYYWDKAQGKWQYYDETMFAMRNIACDHFDMFSNPLVEKPELEICYKSKIVDTNKKPHIYWDKIESWWDFDDNREGWLDIQMLNFLENLDITSNPLAVVNEIN